LRIFTGLYSPLDILPKNEIKRKKVYVIPPAILREILVNALTHRDYSDYGRKTIIQLYKDRFTISNPARFDKNITENDLINYQYSQNPILTRVFFEAGLIEEIGKGYSSSELAKSLDVSKDTILSDLETLKSLINIVDEG